MPINPLISLEGRTVNTANAGNNLVNIMQQSNANKAAQATAERQAQADARSVELHNVKLEEAATKKSKDKEESIILGAASIYDDLKNERFDVVEEKLLKRKSNIQSRIDAGETGLDTKDTDEALDALVNNPLGLLQASESANNEAIRRKLIAKPDKPQDQFTPIEDAEGNIVAQKNETTGKILSDPRADKQTTSEFERLLESSNMTEQKKSELRATRLTRLANGEKGMSLISDGAGGFTLTQGNTDTPEATTKTKGVLQKNIIDAKNNISRLKETAAEFKPEFLTFLGQIKGSLLNYKDKAPELFGKLSDDQKDFLEKFSAFQQDAVSNVNATIQQITGAQMSKSEATRITREVPDPDKDSPTKFIAKLNNSIKRMELAGIRNQYMLNQGITFDFASGKEAPVSMDDMRDIISKRASDIANELQGANPDLGESEIKSQAVQQARAEFLQ